MINQKQQKEGRIYLTSILTEHETEKGKEISQFATILSSLKMVGVTLTKRLIILKMMEKNAYITIEEIRSFYTDNFKQKIDNSTISKIFSHLIKNGLVQECNIIEYYEDRRRKFFKLTEEGQRLLDQFKNL